MSTHSLKSSVTVRILSIGVAACASTVVVRGQVPIVTIVDSTRVCAVEGDVAPPFLVDSLVHYVIERRRYYPFHRLVPRTREQRRRTYDEEIWPLAWQRRRTRGVTIQDPGGGFLGPEFYWVLYVVKYRDELLRLRYDIGLITGNCHPARSPDPTDTLTWFHDNFSIGGLQTDTIVPGSPRGGWYDFQDWHLSELRGRDVRDFLVRQFDWTSIPFDFFRDRTCHYLTWQVNDYVAGAVMSNAWRHLFDEEAPKMEIMQ